MQYDNPLIVQGDRTLLLDVHAPLADECRNALIPFAELERSPEHLHTYRLTPLSLWNAASAGFTADDAVNVLRKFARYDVPSAIEAWIREVSSRFGAVRLVPGYESDVLLKPSEILEAEPSVSDKARGADAGTGYASSSADAGRVGDTVCHSEQSRGISENNKPKTVREQYLYLVCDSDFAFREISRSKSVSNILSPCSYDENRVTEKIELTEKEKSNCFVLKLTDRGTVKQNLLKLSWPVKDEVQLTEGEPLDFSLRETTSNGKPLVVRDYQRDSAKALVGDKGPGTGFGTIVLPCGAGKTIVGMAIMEMLKTSTLIITTNISAVHQWIDELLDKSNLTKDQIAEYSGESKVIAPVTVATYQVLTWRPEKDGPYPHFSLFHKRPWGLIIYDEVHLLPAPVFRVVADLQAVRRVGLTATLVREDGCEGYVFSLVGPKRYDVPWKELEHSGWIAEAECVEVRVDLPVNKEIDYAVAGQRAKHRMASENPAKLKIAEEIINRHPDDKILVIGQYIDQLHEIAQKINAPIITGKTPTAERDRIYGEFRNGKIKVLVVSKVANFAIDLPDASLAIQVSGTFGSRQEEAQRLGRILRPKERKSTFYTLITRKTVEEEFGSNRQKFLAEQGYSYRIVLYNDPRDLDDAVLSIENSGFGNDYNQSENAEHNGGEL